MRAIFGPFWVILGHSWAILGHVWATLVHFGSFLAIFGPFRGIFGQLCGKFNFFAAPLGSWGSLLECMNPAYIYSWFTFIQCSIYRTEPGNTFAWITLTTHACTNFLKILKGFSDFSKTQHVLYFLNAWGSMISNMTYAYILHTYWTHLANILHTYWTHLAHILHTSCAHLAHILH